MKADKAKTGFIKEPRLAFLSLPRLPSVDASDLRPADQGQVLG